MKRLILLPILAITRLAFGQSAPESNGQSCPDFDLCLGASAYAGMGKFSCPHEETVTIAWNTTCPDSDDGMLVANVSGGKPPYSYRWSNGGTDSKITGLAPGTYSITVSDADGCRIERTTSIKAAPAPTIRLHSVLQPGKRKQKGEVTELQVTVEGTQNCYQFQWDGLPDTDSPQLPQPSPGPHRVRITDNNGCVWEETIVVE